MLFSFLRGQQSAVPSGFGPAERQAELGCIAREVLEWATTQNPVHGSVHPETSEFQVWERPDNAGAYLVVVHLRDNDGLRPPFVLNFSVNVGKDEVRVLYTLSGRPETATIYFFAALLVRACAHVQAWRLYPDNVAT